MPTFEFTAPDGKAYEVSGPEGSTQEQAFQMLQQQMKNAAPSAPEKTAFERFKEASKNFGAGAVKGASEIGSTLLTPVDAAARALGVQNDFIGRTDRRQATTDALQGLGADTDSTAFGVGKIGAEIAGTMGAPGVLAKPLIALSRTAPALTPIAQSVATAGMRTGMNPAGVLTAGRAADVGARVVGGTAAGGVASGLVNPEDAGTGAMIGGALPPALQLAGKGGQVIGNVLRGPAAPESTRMAAQNALGAGYVIPPTQVKPTLGNRLLEGFAGKLSTAQNASAANQEVTNNLAKAALGADDLTAEGIAAVRKKANGAYSALGKAGTFQTDDLFRDAIGKAGQRGARFSADFPELVRKDADALLESFGTKESFDAQSAIEAIKRLREGQRAGMKAFDDADKKAFGRVQGQVAEALEGVIERNLEKSGKTELLDQFRKARQTLAKAYDVEKAANATSGNVDARKLGAALKKGRPLSGELRQAAEFGSNFPKAAQPIEGMGSLPQTSPLDWTAAGMTSLAAGNPLPMIGVLARPGARATALSPMVQRQLAQQQALALPPRPVQPLLPILGRTAPVAITGR